MKNSTVETLMGAFVVVVAAGFLVFAYNGSSRSAASGGYNVSASFDNVEGVNIGSDVRMSGIKVGTVVGQSLDPETFQAKLVMNIEPAIKLTDDVSAKVTAEGLLGSKFIALEAGGSDTVLGEGGVITSTQGAIDIWSLISQAMFDKSGASSNTGGSGSSTPAPETPPANDAGTPPAQPQQ